MGIGPGSPISASINASKLDANANYDAVQQQSGLFAGSKGFDVNVKGNTALVGGAIVSEADADKNSLTTDTLTLAKIENSTAFDIDAKSFSFSTNAADNITSAAAGLMGGNASDSGNASNTTYAAISEGNISVKADPNLDLTTQNSLKRSKEQAHQVLAQIFSEDQIIAVQEELEVQEILSKEVPKAIGDYAQQKYTQGISLKLAAAEIQDPEQKKAMLIEANQLIANWDEGGDYRVALHTLSGLISGDLSGAAGAFITAEIIPKLNAQLEKMGMQDSPLKAGLLLAASAAIGSAANGTTGVVNTVGQSANNYLKHSEALRLAKLKGQLLDCENNCNEIIEEIYFINNVDSQRNQYAEQACNLPRSDECKVVIEQLTEFRKGYQKEGVSYDVNIKNESLEVLELNDLYTQREKRPDIYNTIKGTARAVGEGIEGTVELGILSAKATAGDEVSQQQLSMVANAIKEALTHPIDTVQQAISDSLENIEQLKKEDRYDEAQQASAKLFTSGLLTVTSTGGIAIGGSKVVIAGTKGIVKVGKNVTETTVKFIDDALVSWKNRSNGAEAKPDKPNTTTSETETVSRGDDRSPQEIFKDGFQPKDPDAQVDLETYVNSTPSPDSQYVSTSKDIDVSKDFATDYGDKPGNVYIIDKPENGIDVEKTLGGKAAFDEKEIAVPGGVPSCKVQGCQPVNKDGTPSGDFINNPNYVPPEG